MQTNIAIIIPAYNEELTVGEVLEDFYSHCQDATFYVINNNSQDQTKQFALDKIRELKCDGRVIDVFEQGKANAVKHAFKTIDADIYVMVDADMTYSGSDIDKLIQPIKDEQIDMVTGDRLSRGEYTSENKRSFHDFGNQFVRNLINTLFNTKLNDIMSGYRSFSKKFVKNYPILCDGFELETELTIHCLQYKFRLKEVPITYKDRPQGSESKLNTFKDGFRVVSTIFNIFKNYKPLPFFTSASIIFLLLGLGAGSLPVLDFIKHQYVYHVPLAILAVGFMVFSLLLVMCGLILDTVIKLHHFNFEHRILHTEISCSKPKH